MATALGERFWSKVNKDGPVPASRPELGPCWLWTGHVSNRNYGQFLDADGKRTSSHRTAYRLTHGEIPAGMVIDHLCRQTLCQNPAHLEAVSQRANVRRGVGGASKTHCPRGHEYTPDNTYVNRSIHPRYPRRVCRKCAVIHTRAYLARKAVAQ